MIQWFKKHPEHLIRESQALASDGNYKEIFQKRDEFFVSHGSIIVRYESIHRHPILIFYPIATPFQAPEIYPLTRMLTEQEVELIATSGQNNIPKDAINLFYELRHQNANGVLCILEWDNVDTGSKFYGITSILGRVREWFEGHITGVFPPDSEEVDFTAHFSNISQEIKLLYTEEFLDQRYIEGDFIATLMAYNSSGDEFVAENRIYFSIYLSGFNKFGLALNSDSTIHKRLIEDGFESHQDLHTKKPLFQKYVDSNRYIHGYWFDIEQEPKPFKTVSDLVLILGNGSEDTGLDRLASRCKDVFKPLPTEVLIAIRFRNRRGSVEFQLFKVHKKASTATADDLFSTNERNVIRGLLQNYEVVQAIRCEKFTDDSFFQRNSTRADRNKLKQSVANVIGIGAIGSEIADILGKSGIGGLNLIDNQLLRAHNIIRHLAGLEFMEKPKSFAVASIVIDHNPFVHVTPYGHNVMTYPIGVSVPETSISVSSIADDNVEGFLNEQMVLAKKETFYVRALRGGKVARIFRVIPGKDACFFCLQLHRQDGMQYIEVPTDPLHPTLKNECNNPIRPASAADLKLIAAISSSFIINHLQNGPSDANHWIWSTEIIEGTPIDTPFKLFEQHLVPHQSCPYCNDDKNSQAIISTEVLQDIKTKVLNKKGIETGGVLAGFIDENDSYIITHASGPGPKAIEEPTRFEKDIEFCQKFLDDLFTEYGAKAVYLGEWHSHPNKDNRPSNLDINSLSNIAMQKGYLTDRPIMIIFSNDGVPSSTVHPAGKMFHAIKLVSGETIN